MAKKQTTLSFKPVKKGKKRNPWSDSESDMSSNESNFDVPPREKDPRRAATKTKFTMDLDSDEDFSGSDGKDEDEDFFPLDTIPPKTKTSQRNTKKALKPQKSTMSADLESDVQDSVPASPGPPAADSPADTEQLAPASKQTVAVKKTATKSQSSTSTAVTKKRAVPKGTKSDSALNAHGPEKPEPAKAKKSSRKRKQSSSDDSDSDFEKAVSKAALSKKPKEENQDFQVDLDETIAPRTKSGRARKPIKYLEESDEDDLF